MKKKIPILILICTVWQLQAQNKEDKLSDIHFLFNYGNNPQSFDYRGIPRETGMYEQYSGFVFYDTPFENYQQYQAAVRLIIPLQNELQFVSRYNTGIINYEFTQYRGTYDYGRQWQQGKTSFLIGGQIISAYGGIGKAFFLGKKKQFSIIPNILLGFDGNIYSGEQIETFYWGLPDNSYALRMDQIRVGTELNLAFQYMLTKKLGVTVSFERLVYGYFKRETQESYFKLEETQNSKHVEYFVFPNNVYFGVAFLF